MTRFVIFALPLSGGILALAPLPGRGGSCAADLDHLRDWKPALVISMTTPSELERHGVAGLGADIQASGSRWIHFPVADMGVPGQGQHDLWQRISRDSLAALRGGGRVLVHCLGGCGRSGMAVLRLMIETGEGPPNALKRLRSVRPCAVETEAQMAWALQGR